MPSILANNKKNNFAQLGHFVDNRIKFSRLFLHEHNGDKKKKKKRFSP